MSEKFSSSRILENIVEEQIPSEKLLTSGRDSYMAQLSNQDSCPSDNYEITNGDNVVEMIIELDQENSVVLIINEHDDPFVLAKKFCYSHNIDPKVILTLGNNIKNIQKSQFGPKQEYSDLIARDTRNLRTQYTEGNKQNNGIMGNLKTVDSGLKRSKATRSSHQKHNTTTFINDTTFEYNTNAHSYANLSRTTVFQRLYNDSKRKYTKRELSKEESCINKSTIKDISMISCAPQLRIYERNTKLRQETLKKNQTIRNVLESLTDNSFSHAPEINPVSRLIAQKLKQINYDPYKKSKEKSMKKSIEYLKQRELESLKQCTFKPKILHKTTKNSETHSDRFILLHEDYYMRQNKMQTIKANETNKKDELSNPSINQISKKIVGKKGFNARMKEYEVSSIEKKRRIIAESRSNEKFRPQINRIKSKGEFEQSSLMRSFDRLYYCSKSKENTGSKKPRERTNSFTNKISQKIYEENKRNAFRYIFTLMDNDEDGLISSLKINIFGLGTEILNMMAPLLCEMEDVGAQLDEEEFVDSMERLFKTFTVHEKNMMLNIYKNPLRKSKSSQEPSFHPSLNQRSLQIARELREQNTSLYDIGRQKQYEKEEKLAKLRELKQLLEFEECTFQPNLFYHHI